MVEYTAFVIENDNILKENFQRIFLDKNIIIDQTYINEVIELRKLYKQISNIYNNNAQSMKQFLQTIKQSIVKNIGETFMNFPKIVAQIFRNFYSKFFNLIELFDGNQKRIRTIKNSLQKIGLTENRIISKYDYYFSGIMSKSYSIEGFIDYLSVVISPLGKEFIIATERDKVYLWDPKTDEQKILTVNYNTRIVPTKFSILYDNKLFIAGSKVIGSDRTIAGYSLFDLDSGEQKNHQFNTLDDFSINDAQLFIPEDKIPRILIGSEYGSFLVLNTESWQLKRLNEIHQNSFLILKTPLDDGSQIITSNRGHINFWNINEEKLLYTIGFTSIIINQISYFDDDHILIQSDKQLIIFNFKLSKIVKEFNGLYNIEKMLILFNKDIIIGTFDDIYLLGSKLDFKHKIGTHKELINIYQLPNNQIVTVSSNSLRIWDIEEENYLYETNEIKDEINILNDSRIVTKGKNMGEIVIYE